MNRITGTELSAWIDRHGFTRQGAADALGVSRSQVQRCLVGSVPPSVSRTIAVYDEGPEAMQGASGVRSASVAAVRTLPSPPALPLADRDIG